MVLSYDMDLYFLEDIFFYLEYSYSLHVSLNLFLLMIDTLRTFTLDNKKNVSQVP